MVFSHRPERGWGVLRHPLGHTSDSLHLVYIEPRALKVEGVSPGSQGKLPVKGSQGPGDSGWSRLHSLAGAGSESGEGGGHSRWRQGKAGAEFVEREGGASA